MTQAAAFNNTDPTPPPGGPRADDTTDTGVFTVKMLHGTERLIVTQRLQQQEADRALRIRMTQSQLRAPLGPLVSVLLTCCPGLITWLKRKELWPWEFYDVERKAAKKAAEAETETKACKWWPWGQYPASMLSPQNMYNALLFKWTTWGFGDAEEAKEQLLNEQASIALVSALVLSVATTFLASLLTPDRKGEDLDDGLLDDGSTGDDNSVVMNFPSRYDSINWIIVNCMTIAFFCYMIATLLAV